MAAPIDFYFDFASPYAYLARGRLGEIAGRHGRTVTWRPILLGAVFKITGMKPLVDLPLRSDYMRRDILRFARLLGVPITIPAQMPLHSLIPSRAFYWLDGTDPALAVRFADDVFRAHFEQGGYPASLAAVQEIAAGLGVDADVLAAGCQDAATKERLRAEVDHAIARGVFGAPTMVVDGEMFWGADRLDQVERWLETGGW